jgi:hypothetical protein
MAAFLIIALTSTTLAESGKTQPKGKTPPRQQVEPQKPLEEMTCGDLTFLLGDEKRIDDATYLMIWAYGVRTGAAGGDLKENPFDGPALEAFVKSLIKQCNADSEAKVMPLIIGVKEGPK